MIKKITADEFHELVKQDKEVVVKFGAAWCGPCRVQTKQLENAGVEAYEIDVDAESELAASLRIRNIPNLKVFRSNTVLRDFVGPFASDDDAQRFVEGV